MKKRIFGIFIVIALISGMLSVHGAGNVSFTYVQTESADRMSYILTFYDIPAAPVGVLTIKIINPDGNSIHYNQVDIENSGSASDRFYLLKGNLQSPTSGDISGAYSVFAAGDKAGEIYFMNTYDDQGILAVINAAKTAAEVLAFLETAPSSSGIDKAILNSVTNKQKVLESLANQTYTSSNEFRERYELGVAIQLVNEASADNILSRLSNPILKLKLDGSFGSLGSMGKSIILSKMSDIEFEINDLSGLQGSFYDLSDLELLNELTIENRDKAAGIIESMAKYLDSADKIAYDGL